jgi:hypothetical protein
LASISRTTGRRQIAQGFVEIVSAGEQHLQQTFNALFAAQRAGMRIAFNCDEREATAQAQAKGARHLDPLRSTAAPLVLRTSLSGSSGRDQWRHAIFPWTVSK